jgi:hypothetical protein
LFVYLLLNEIFKFTPEVDRGIDGLRALFVEVLVSSLQNNGHLGFLEHVLRKLPDENCLFLGRGCVSSILYFDWFGLHEVSVPYS